jgi:hypothetical protein
VRATHVKGGEIDWAETDPSVELSKKGDGHAALGETPGVDGHNLILRWKRPSADSTLTVLVGSKRGGRSA